MRMTAALRIADQLWMMHHFLLRNLPRSYLAYLSMSALSRGLNILALAGTLKVAAVILLDWTKAIQIGEKVGLSLQGMTKSNFAIVCAAIIMALYALYAIALRSREKLKAEFSGRVELEVVRTLLSDEIFPHLAVADKFRSEISKGVKAYQLSAAHLADATACAILSLLIIVVLGIYLPVLVAFFAVLILPILLFYLLAGRRMSFVRKELDELQGKQPLEKSITSKQVGPDGTLDALCRAEVLAGMQGSIAKKMQLQSGRSAPEFVTTLAVGAALAVTLFSLSNIEVQPANLVFLLIGFILVRFLFGFVRVFMANFQGVMQNLEGVCFVNEMVAIGASSVSPTYHAIEDRRSEEPQSSQA